MKGLEESGRINTSESQVNPSNGELNPISEIENTLNKYNFIYFMNPSCLRIYFKNKIFKELT